MFLDNFNFIFNWLFGGGLPTFLTLDVANWIAFGVTCAVIIIGILIISLPLMWFVKKILEW